MEDNLLTAGQFAKLARTTKRTITWYSDQGILKPFKIGTSNYRYYKPQQIMDFQVILLLRRLRFSIEEIKEYLHKNLSLKDLFELKKVVVKKEIKELQKTMDDLDRYYQNLDSQGNLVTPIVKKVKPFSIYYLEKEGPYAKSEIIHMNLNLTFVKFPVMLPF